MVVDSEAAPEVAYLKNMFKASQGVVLHQAEISVQKSYASFAEFAGDFMVEARYPSPQSAKFETYSFSPTLYDESLWAPKSRPDAKPKRGVWRVGEAAAPVVTVGYFDLDNHHADRAMVGLDDVEEILRSIGVSYLLYTSYSHRPEKHKVRILCPVSRHPTWAEMNDVFARLNEAFDYQLDGSIYDPGDHLYGPTYGGESRLWLGGQSLDVDAVLGLPLSEEAAQYARQIDGRTTKRREWSEDDLAEYKAKITDESIDHTITVENPVVFNPAWFELLDSLYKGGHRQSLLGVMAKVWLKSKGTLTIGDMRAIQFELDMRWGLYCARTYGKAALDSDLRSSMTIAVSEDSPEDHKRKAMERNLKRFLK